MRSSYLTGCLLSSVLIVSGCSQTGALRSSNTSDVKTIASVGDKPLPIVSGEPGASLRAETEDVDRPARSGSRISGRVYDERGKPVPGAKVRLAVGGAAGGKAFGATTDRSGAFTLSGLRSGSAYTVVAEYEDEVGMMSGRVQVKARDGRPHRTAGSRRVQSRTRFDPAGAGLESSRSLMLILRMKNPSMKVTAGRKSELIPKTSSRQPPKPRPCYPIAT